MTLNYWVLGAAVLALLLAGYAAFIKPPATFSGAAGPTHTELQEFLGGIVNGLSYATSTTATSYTLVASDIVRPDGASYDTIMLTPNTGDLTLTLPASSTLSRLVPRAGMTSRMCLYNASTTAGIDITVAGATGIDLEVSSSTTSGITALTILSNSMSCFKFTRKPATATAFDIIATFERFAN